LAFEHQAVSHLTGTTTFLSLAITHSNIQEIVHLLLIIVSFIIGAAYSGLVIGNTALKLGRPYSFALITESALLFMSMHMLNHGSFLGQFFASAACGLQNAMTSTYSGAVVRTTHVSGLFTDLGVALGLRFRGQKTDSRRIALYCILISGFIVGGVIGSLLFAKFRFSALLAPCILTAFIAVSYWVFLQNQGRGKIAS
jgi:uncharacterized membrane protein YoaK (UPF0700 family)